ncbi:hypothetical protein [Fimbriiglobus ruber]|uniref:Uncharacterized protein n=1 Tax=Fimbriiglobus ruber TaxID=1908690 RepID=A0A225E5M9_9BACT|nr:hypothetical protein [Fimbriiglobus ruber]OWK45416.1 hypothetical protein FRUB_01747 [Fimbriiglobus ruber]
MSEPNRDGWLVAIGLAYPVAAFGALLGCGGQMGLLAFHPLTVPLPAVLLAAIVIGLWSNGVRFRWWAVALLVAWLCVVVYAQWWVYAEAAAGV